MQWVYRSIVNQIETPDGKFWDNIVSILLQPWGSISHNGFLGGDQFKFEQPGGVIKVGFY